MPETGNDLRADVRARAIGCLTLVECVQVALEMARRKAVGDESTLIDLGAIGRFIDELGEEMKDLNVLLKDLLEQEISLDPGVAATALAFYADPKNYRAVARQVSKVAEDAGRIAREALVAISAGEGDPTDD